MSVILRAAGVDGDTTNPDVVRFRRVAAGTWVIVILTLVFVAWAWRDQSEVIFALPAFPQMGDCSTFADPANPPPVVELFLSRDGDNEDEAFQLAKDDCEHNLLLLADYDDLKEGMVRYAVGSDVEQISAQARTPEACPNPDEIQVGNHCLSIDADTGAVFNWQMMQLSIESMIRTLAMLIGVIGTFIYSAWGGTEKTRASHELYRRGMWRYITSAMLAAVMGGLAYVSIDVVWFMFGRVVPLPVLYPTGTGILFTGLVIGVLFFLVMLAVSEIRIEAMSVLATMVLTLGMIAGILTTNHVWDSGQTNAYSAMSERAYPERLAFDVAGDLGSRRIFRVTLIASGVLLMTYAIQLHFVVRTLKEQNKLYHRTPEYANRLRPRWIAFFAAIAGLLTTLVGWFPTDGTFIPNPTSTLLHMLGAFGGPMLMLVLMITVWFIGHPIESAYIPRLNLTSLNTVTIFSVAVIMHLFGYRQALQHPMWIGATIGFAVFLLGMFLLAQRWHGSEVIPRNGIQRYNHSIAHWVLIVVVGIGLALVFPNLMTTVTLEFAVLTTFSLFIYAYSLYTAEFMDLPVFSDAS